MRTPFNDPTGSDTKTDGRLNPAPSSLVASVAWVSGGNGGRASMQIVTAMVLARLLTPADFGTVAIGVSIVGVASLIAQAGLSGALIRLGTPLGSDIRRAFLIAIPWSTFVAASVCVFAPRIAAFYDNGALVGVIIWLSITCILQAVYGVCHGGLSSHKRFSTLVKIGIVSQMLGYGSVAITVAWLGFGYWSIVAATISRSLFLTILGCIALRGTRFEADTPTAELQNGEYTSVPSKWHRLLPNASGMVADGVVLYGAENADYFVVGRTLGTEQLGVYSRAFTLMSMPISHVASAIGAVMTVNYASSDLSGRQLASRYYAASGISCFLVAPALVVCFMYPAIVVSALFGHEWLASALALKWLSIAGFARVLAQQAMAMIRGRGSLVQLTVCHGLSVALSVTAVALTSEYGITGVAKGVAASSLVASLAYQVAVFTEIRFALRDFAVSLLPAASLVASTATLLSLLSTLTNIASANPFVAIGAIALATLAALTANVLFMPRVFCSQEMASGFDAIARKASAYLNRVA